MNYEDFKKSVLRALDDSEPCDLKALEELNGEWFDEILKENIER
jgi:hypothetical protein